MGFRVLVAVVVLLATGCGSGAAGGNSVQGKVFTSTSVTEQGEPRALVEGTKIELRFIDDRLLATAGCNQMQGQVKLDGGKLAVTDLSTTDMACPTPGLHEQDEWLSRLLNASPAWKLDGTNLVLTGPDAEIVLAQEQPATLEGTWTVDGLVKKDVVSSAPEGVTGTVSFKEGFIYVGGGCNSGSTKVTGADEYEVDGQTITFGELVVTAMMCAEDKMRVDSAILDTLGLRKVTFEIDRDTMTLMNAEGTGLKLRK